MAAGATAGAEALLTLNPIQRAQQKSKELEHQSRNVTLNGLQTVRREQYLWLEISISFFRQVFGEMGVNPIPLSRRGGTLNRLFSMIRRVKLWRNGVSSSAEPVGRSASGTTRGEAIGILSAEDYVDHWVKILTDTPTEILYAAADAEKISEYVLGSNKNVKFANV
jgi:hypothetical protein